MMMMMMTTKRTKIHEEEEKPYPGGGEGGSTSPSPSPSPSPPGPHSQDRISELPVEILVHILGFLEMDELLIGTSLVSTKWRNLWKSVSTLKFPRCCSSIKFQSGTRNNVEKYNKFVDHVLSLRDSQASKIQVFNCCLPFVFESNYDNLEQLNNLIVSAVNQGAQEIEIGGHSNGSNIIHLNPSIFTSGLLRVFVYSILHRDIGFKIHFPRSMCCATHLTHLTLTSIRLPEGDDAAQLHLVCPLLETFHMRFCVSEHLKVLDISAPKLNTLSIYNVGMRFDALGGCRIEIRTPNLTSLVYRGDVYVDCFTENLPRLVFAFLDFTKETRLEEKTTSFATKLLKGLTSAKSLSLAGFEVFSQDTLKVLLTPFTSLRTLEFASIYKSTRSSIHGMVHILNICNSVEKFVWNVNPFDEVEGDEDLMLPQCRLSHLKHVHIQRLHGHQNEIEFVKFLVKSSVVLEDLLVVIKSITCSPKKLIEENLKQFIGEEPSFRSIKLRILLEESWQTRRQHSV